MLALNSSPLFSAYDALHHLKSPSKAPEHLA